MKKLIEIFNERNVSKEKMEKIISMLDEKADEQLCLAVTEELMDGHLCEMTAMKKVSEMVPVILYSAPNEKWQTGEQHPMPKYMETMGLTAQRCYDMVMNACEKAKEKGASLGISAPSIPQETTIWDAYYSIAMCNSDYWITLSGDQEKAAIMAYEIISDPDK